VLYIFLYGNGKHHLRSPDNSFDFWFPCSIVDLGTIDKHYVANRNTLFSLGTKQAAVGYNFHLHPMWIFNRKK